MTTWCRSIPEPARNAGTRKIASLAEQYFSEAAPIVIDNHVLVGAGN